MEQHSEEEDMWTADEGYCVDDLQKRGVAVLRSALAQITPCHLMRGYIQVLCS